MAGDTHAFAEHARDRSTGQSSWLVIVCVDCCVFGQPTYYAMPDAGCQEFWAQNQKIRKEQRNILHIVNLLRYLRVALLLLV